MASHVAAYILGLSVMWIGARGWAQDGPSQLGGSPPAKRTNSGRRAPRLDVLSDEQWKRIDNSVDRALAFLITQQSSDGSFVTKPSGQPGVTALCVMAFLSSGHSPGQGRYGTQIDRAIDFVLGCQHEDGLFSLEGTALPADVWSESTHAATYNHAITGLMLGEVYGQTGAERGQKIRPAIVRALEYTRRMQLRRKRHPVDKGGWRYIKDVPVVAAAEAMPIFPPPPGTSCFCARQETHNSMCLPIMSWNRSISFVTATSRRPGLSPMLYIRTVVFLPEP